MDANFAQMSSLVDQRPNTTKPVAITLSHNDAICGISHVSEHSKDIIIEESGVYILIAAPQVGRLTGTEDRYVDFWLRRNGKDIPNSNIRLVTHGKNSKDVIVNQTMMPFDKDDVINVMMSVETVGEGLGIETIHPKGEPTIPSIIFSMLKVTPYEKLINQTMSEFGLGAQVTV